VVNHPCTTSASCLSVSRMFSETILRQSRQNGGESGTETMRIFKHHHVSY
jgi:hypothetical protein